VIASKLLLSSCVIAIGATSPGQQKPVLTSSKGAETFKVTATVSSNGQADGAITVPLVVRLDRFTPEPARVAMTDALKYNGYPGFLNALRAAPSVGVVTVAGRSYTVRWAREESEGEKRAISVVTDQPVFFIGGGRPNAKRTAGYEIAIIQMTLDHDGRGDGTMAAAARVKPRGTTGVQIDDYAETPIKLTVGTPAGR
jgi:hypothetical protein